MARFVRLRSLTPTNNGNTATRIYEIEVYGAGAAVTGAVASGIAGKCLDDSNGSTANGNPIQLWTCNSSAAQAFTLNDDRSLRTQGKCVDATGGGTTNGTKLELLDCDGSAKQQWEWHSATMAFVNPASGRCIDDPSSSTTDGTQLQLWDCNATGAQQWSVSLQ
jgi:hypothetical protein